MLLTNLLGAAYSIVLEENPASINTDLDGKMLSRASEALDEIATEHGIRPLTGFTSIDPKKAAFFLQTEDLDTSGVELPPVQHFNAEEGLTTIKALISHLELKPASVRNSERVLRDLRDCNRILTAARDQGLRWHFEVSL